MTNKITYTLVGLFLIAFWSFAIWLSWQFVPMERRIDCSIAEFHPDYPPEVKKACREQRKRMQT
jgi:hypothetical protein